MSLDFGCECTVGRRHQSTSVVPRHFPALDSDFLQVNVQHSRGFTCMSGFDLRDRATNSTLPAVLCSSPCCSGGDTRFALSSQQGLFRVKSRLDPSSGSGHMRNIQCYVTRPTQHMLAKSSLHEQQSAHLQRSDTDDICFVTRFEALPRIAALRLNAASNSVTIARQLGAPCCECVPIRDVVISSSTRRRSKPSPFVLAPFLTLFDPHSLGAGACTRHAASTQVTANRGTEIG